jgi:type IV secretory pathway VirD2 relaxase
MIAKGSGYVKGNKQAAQSRLGAHFGYIEHRAMNRELETRDDRRIFSKDEDVVSRKNAVEDVMDHTSGSVNYHKIVLSPGEDEPINDWREWTRDVMSDLEERQGKDLHWYAVKHDNTDNPHVHVVLAGAGENRESGKSEPVRMYAPDYQSMRESGREHSERGWHDRIESLVKEYDRHDSVEHDQERSQQQQDHTIERGDFDR